MIVVLVVVWRLPCPPRGVVEEVVTMLMMVVLLTRGVAVTMTTTTMITVVVDVMMVVVWIVTVTSACDRLQRNLTAQSLIGGLQPHFYSSQMNCLKSFGLSETVLLLYTSQYCTALL
jgi:hypothetical protein